MRIKTTFMAAMAAGALLAAAPAFGQSGSAGQASPPASGLGAGPGAGGGSQASGPSQGMGSFDGYKIAHGPGVVDGDTKAAQARMYGELPKASPKTDAHLTERTQAAMEQERGPVFAR